jgi:hypothetical protein
MKLYKILVNGESSHGGNLKWSLPKNGKPGKWNEVKGDLKICNKGLHLTSKPYNWYKWGCTNYEAEAKGIKEWDGDKCVARKVRLLKEVPHPKWWLKAEKFVNTELKEINWLKSDGKPLKKWKVFYGDSWNAAMIAAGDAAMIAARVAAGVAAGDAAMIAARDAAGNAARDAAMIAAMIAAGDAAMIAAGVAAGVAAGDAALYVQTEYICEGTKLAKKHIKHARERMKVWRKGYALLGDVNGVLYVYYPNKHKTK